MSANEPWLIGAAEYIFQTPVRAKKHKLGNSKLKPLTAASPASQMLGRIRRVIQRKPEVMVKVSGGVRNKQHIREHLAYITRNGKLMAERENGESIQGAGNVREVAAEWWADRGKDRPRHARETVNIVLSMPAGSDRHKVAAAASAFAKAQFGGEHDYLLVHHGDTDHPHAHLTVRTVGFHGACLNPRKDDLQAWRERFAEQLRAHGVEAEATPRRARGVTRKGQKQAVRHMDKRQASRFTREKIRSAVEAVRKGTGQGAGGAAERPWEAATRNRQSTIRASWNKLASALDAHGEVALALQVKAFVSSMPAVATERDLLLARVMQAVPQEKGQTTPEQTRRR